MSVHDGPEYAQELTDIEMLFTVSAGVLILASIISSIGLFFLKQWAAWVFLSVNAALFMIMPFAGPFVEHGLMALGDIEMVALGMIVAIVLFTNVVGETNANA